MGNEVVVMKLPPKMMWRLLPYKVSNSEFAYANIRHVAFIPNDDKSTRVVFDENKTWNYTTDESMEELFGRLAGY